MRDWKEWRQEWPDVQWQEAPRDKMQFILSIQADTLRSAMRLAAGFRHGGGSAGDVEAALRGWVDGIEKTASEPER